MPPERVDTLLEAWRDTPPYTMWKRLVQSGALRDPHDTSVSLAILTEALASHPHCVGLDAVQLGDPFCSPGLAALLRCQAWDDICTVALTPRSSPEAWDHVARVWAGTTPPPQVELEAALHVLRTVDALLPGARPSAYAMRSSPRPGETKALLVLALGVTRPHPTALVPLFKVLERGAVFLDAGLWQDLACTLQLHDPPTFGCTERYEAPALGRFLVEQGLRNGCAPALECVWWCRRHLPGVLSMALVHRHHTTLCQQATLTSALLRVWARHPLTEAELTEYGPQLPPDAWIRLLHAAPASGRVALRCASAPVYHVLRALNHAPALGWTTKTTIRLPSERWRPVLQGALRHLTHEGDLGAWWFSTVLPAAMRRRAVPRTVLPLVAQAVLVTVRPPGRLLGPGSRRTLLGFRLRGLLLALLKRPPEEPTAPIHLITGLYAAHWCYRHVISGEEDDATLRATVLEWLQGRTGESSGLDRWSGESLLACLEGGRRPHPPPLPSLTGTPREVMIAASVHAMLRLHAVLVLGVKDDEAFVRDLLDQSGPDTWGQALCAGVLTLVRSAEGRTSPDLLWQPEWWTRHVWDPLAKHAANLRVLPIAVVQAAEAWQWCLRQQVGAPDRTGPTPDHMRALLQTLHTATQHNRKVPDTVVRLLQGMSGEVRQIKAVWSVGDRRDMEQWAPAFVPSHEEVIRKLAHALAHDEEGAAPPKRRRVEET